MVSRLLKKPQSSVSDGDAKNGGTDGDLQQRLMNFLHERQIPEGETLEVEARGGVVVVAGRLPSQHAKWLCIGCCRHVAGVIKLIDGIEVCEDSSSDRATLASRGLRESREQTGWGPHQRADPGGDGFEKPRDRVSSVTMVINEPTGSKKSAGNGD